MQHVYLLCNAHLDPVWQWEWDEGLAEALSTFRIAANFCEEFDGFVFNHNEAILYQWVEEYEPDLFARIQKLVQAGKWHIMGGWFLQPDCLMSSGESIARHITAGRRYFMEKFGKAPTTAINFDSFGHDRGLVQIMTKSGYDSYLIGRPPIEDCGVPDHNFLWKGYDGSQLKVRLFNNGYNSQLGDAANRIRQLIAESKDQENVLILWGIGNHGGGPSRVDLQDIAKLQEEMKDSRRITHSTPEEFFAKLDAATLPEHDKDITPVMIGCYTSMVRIKQMHRQLESLLFETEKMAVAAENQYGAVIDWDVIRQVEQTLRFNEFHDILPGSSIQRAETAAIQDMGGAIEALKKVRTKAFITMAQQYKAPETGILPVFIYNPHPWELNQVVECEFQLANQNWESTVTDFDVYCGGRKISSQLIKEGSSIALDWRKRLALQVRLAPFSMAVLECHPRILASKPVIPQPEGRYITLENDRAVLKIDTTTGLIASYQVDGTQLVREDTCRLAVLPDDEDPWRMRHVRLEEPIGAFSLASAEEAGYIAAQAGAMPPVRIVEDGEVETVVEAIFTYRKSFAVIHYVFNHSNTKVGIEIEMLWQEPGMAVKLEIPTALEQAVCLGDGMFGYRALYQDGRENAAQKWLAAANDSRMVTLYNLGTYGSSYQNGVISQTLLRSPAYCAHPIEDRQILPVGRYFPRIDIGKRSFRFVLDGGDRAQQLAGVQKQAAVLNEAPVALSFYTKGSTEYFEPFATLDREDVILSAMKRAADGEGYILRLYHSSAEPCTAKLSLPVWELEKQLDFGPFEVRTLRVKDGSITDTTMDERPL